MFSYQHISAYTTLINGSFVNDEANEFGVKSKTSVLILFVCVCVCSCPDLRSEIEDASARFTEAFNRQDAEVVSQLYTEDCALMPTGVDIINGRKSQCYNVNTCPYACTYSTLWDSCVLKCSHLMHA